MQEANMPHFLQDLLKQLKLLEEKIVKRHGEADVDVLLRELWELGTREFRLWWVMLAPEALKYIYFLGISMYLI